MARDGVEQVVEWTTATAVIRKSTSVVAVRCMADKEDRSTIQLPGGCLVVKVERGLGIPSAPLLVRLQCISGRTITKLLVSKRRRRQL